MNVPALPMIGLAGLLVIFAADGGAAYAQQPGACGYYKNRYDQLVPSLCGDWHANPPGTVPNNDGATALCRDGLYSFSRQPVRPGTCSHHGGVAEYLP